MAVEDIKGGIEAIISSLYTNFLLRDVAAKIVPGSALLLALPIYHTSWACVLAWLRGASFLELLAFLSAAWAASYAVQALGEQTKWIHQWTQDYGDFLLRYKARVLFSRYASDHERRLVERYVVIKEASGTISLVLVLSAILVLGQWLADKAVDCLYPGGGTLATFLDTWSIPIIALGFAVYYFRMSHERHLERQYSEINAVILLGPHNNLTSKDVLDIRHDIMTNINKRGRPADEHGKNLSNCNHK